MSKLHSISVSISNLSTEKFKKIAIFVAIKVKQIGFLHI